jgi:hypothetical protein
VELKLVPIYVAVLVAALLAQSKVAIIITGGVGKNGSTVAVSNAMFQCCFFVISDPALPTVRCDFCVFEWTCSRYQVSLILFGNKKFRNVLPCPLPLLSPVTDADTVHCYTDSNFI